MIKSGGSYHDLYIYLIEGVVPAEDEATLGEQFIGRWIEGESSFLFFSEYSHEKVDVLLRSRPKGSVLSEGQGSSLLGDPLNVVIWIRDSLNAQGIKLNKGDLLSLGSITKPTPPTPNTTLRAVYLDLDPKGPVEIYVKFK